MSILKRRINYNARYDWLDHKTYEHVTNEATKDLIVLCKNCHRKIHKIRGKEDGTKRNN